MKEGVEKEVMVAVLLNQAALEDYGVGGGRLKNEDFRLLVSNAPWLMDSPSLCPSSAVPQKAYTKSNSGTYAYI